MELEQQPIKVYARCNEKGEVEQFLETAHYGAEILETDIFIDEGFGDEYAYPHTRQENPLIAKDMQGILLWKNDNGTIRKKTAEELQMEIDDLPTDDPSAPSAEERIEILETQLTETQIALCELYEGIGV